MSALGTFLVVLVCVFLVLTILAQNQMLSSRIAVVDPFHLIPRWTFFAPNPAVHDTNLVVRRVGDEAGTQADWHAVKICDPRHWSDLIWNPKKRVHKMVTDLAQSLMMLRLRSHIGHDGCPTTLPYLLLFNFCANSAGLRDGERCEFGVVRSSGLFDARLWLVYRSGVHAL